MSSPIDGFETVESIETPDYWYIQIAGSTQAGVVISALEAAMNAGIIKDGWTESLRDQPTGQVCGWRVTIETAVERRHAEVGDYMVVGYSGSGTMVSIELLRGTESTNTENRTFSDHFTAGE